MSTPSKYAFYVSCLILFVAQAFAQDNGLRKPVKNLWFSATASLAVIGGEPGFGGELGIGYAREKNYFAAEYSAVSQFPFYQVFSTSESFYIFSAPSAFVGGNFYYGRIVRTGFFKITYAAGVSLLWADEHKAEGDVVFRAKVFHLGLPLQIQLIFTPVRVLAIGMKIHANINTYNSMASIAFGIYFGKVR